MSNPSKMFDVKIIGLSRNDKGVWVGLEAMTEALEQGYEIAGQWDNVMGTTFFLRRRWPV